MRACFAPALGVGMASFVLFSSLSAEAGPADCILESTLESLVTCLRDYMPGRGSGGFVRPNLTERAAYRDLVASMMAGHCDFDPPAVLAPLVELRTFFDVESGRDYCVLYETADAGGDGMVDRGFGTFIVDPAAEREISHQAPHPIADAGTDVQAVTLFKGTHSRSYLVAGAHRDALASGAACTGGDATPSDVAHDARNMFYAANEALVAHYGSDDWTAIQWHGMAAGTCARSDVHMTHGLGLAPSSGEGIVVLRRNVLARHPAWKITLAGSNRCPLDATENVEGRLLNDVPTTSVCASAAASSTGRFFHIEQDPGFRAAEDWIDAIEATFPVP
jgi:hypothetical protein